MAGKGGVMACFGLHPGGGAWSVGHWAWGMGPGAHSCGRTRPHATYVSRPIIQPSRSICLCPLETGELISDLLERGTTLFARNIFSAWIFMQIVYWWTRERILGTNLA